MDFNELQEHAKELTEAQRVALADTLLAGTPYVIQKKPSEPHVSDLQVKSLDAEQIEKYFSVKESGSSYTLEAADVQKEQQKEFQKEWLKKKHEKFQKIYGPSALKNAKYEYITLDEPEPKNQKFAKLLCSALDAKFYEQATFSYSLMSAKICTIYRCSLSGENEKVFAGVDDNGYLYAPQHFSEKNQSQVMGSDATFYIGSAKTLTMVVHGIDLEGKFWSS